MAPDRSLTRRAQRVVKVPHRWLFNGCEVDRDPRPILAAAGFAAVDVEEVDGGAASTWTRTRLIGTATR